MLEIKKITNCYAAETLNFNSYIHDNHRSDPLNLSRCWQKNN